MNFLKTFFKIGLTAASIVAFIFISGCTESKTQSTGKNILGSFEITINGGTGETTIKPLDSSAKFFAEKKFKSISNLGPLYNLGWDNSLNTNPSSAYAKEIIRVAPTNCANADYNAPSGILTGTVKLISQTEPGGTICSSSDPDVNQYCGETYLAPLELRVFYIETYGICDTIAYPDCGIADLDPGTPTFQTANITGINLDSGCSPIEDSNGDGVLDCLSNDVDFTYTPPDYPEYTYHPTWDYTDKCDTQTSTPTQALDPGEQSGCKFLQFNFDHPQLDANHIPVIKLFGDVLGYVQGAGLNPPTVAPVTSPTNVDNQNISVTLDTGDGADTAKITGGVADITCADNDPCDLDATAGVVEINVSLNTNQTNHLYAFQLDTIAPTNESPGTYIPIIHDNIAPEVNSTTPAPNAVDISPSTNVLINFSEPILPGSVSSNSIILTEGGTPVTSTITLSPDGYTATINPDSDLASNRTHTILVCGASGSCSQYVQDLAGNDLTNDYTSSFTTGSNDPIPPIIMSTNPPDNASDVSLNTTVQINFSEAIDETSLSGNIIVEDPLNPVSGTLELSVDGETAIFTPDVDLDALTEYTVTVYGGGTGIQDLAGNDLQDNLITTFTTGSVVDTDPPDVVSTTPINNATNVGEYITPEIVFDEAIDSATIISANLFLKKKLTEEIITSIVSLSEDGLTATCDPNNPLENDTIYVLTIGELIKDLAGNSLLTPQTVEFRTAATPDTTQPYVASVDPFWFESGVSLYVRPVINFSEPMDVDTISSANFKICETRFTNCATSEDIYVELSDDGLTAYLELLNPPLRTNRDHSIWIDAGASGVKDLAGNDLVDHPECDTGWYCNPFRTSNDPVDPYATGMAPSDGSTGVSTSTNVVINFSEPIDPTTISDTTLYLHVNGSSTHIAGTLTVLPDDTWVRFNPTSALLPNTQYDFDATSGITDYAGRNLTPYTGSFTTDASGDTDGPVVLSTDPTDASTDIERFYNITVTFDEPIDPVTVDFTTVELVRVFDSTKVSADISLSADDTVLTINPYDLLESFEYYTVNLKTGIRNLSGFALQSFTTFGFQTIDTSGDTTAPYIVEIWPDDGDTNIDKTFPTPGYIIWSEPIDPDSAHDGNISFEYCPNGYDSSPCYVEPEIVTVVDLDPGDTGYPMENAKVLIDPYNTLRRRRWYRTYVEEYVTDYAGNQKGFDTVPYWKTGR